METIQVKTDRRTHFLDVTEMVRKLAARSGIITGICYLCVPHTTAAATINEHYDPDIAADVESALAEHLSWRV